MALSIRQRRDYRHHLIFYFLPTIVDFRIPLLAPPVSGYQPTQVYQRFEKECDCPVLFFQAIFFFEKMHTLNFSYRLRKSV